MKKTSNVFDRTLTVNITINNYYNPNTALYIWLGVFRTLKFYDDKRNTKQKTKNLKKSPIHF